MGDRVLKALVAGATGGTGSRIVAQLVQRGIPVRALVRDLATAEAKLPAEAERVQGDVTDKASLAKALAGCDVLICATGARPSLDPRGPFQVDYVGTKQLVEAAKVAGIDHVVMVSSLCVSKILHPLNLFWLVLYWKKQAETYLQASGLTYTIVRPGGLTHTDDDPRPLVMAAADTLIDGSVSRWKVAEVCVEALFEPAARNRIVELVAQTDATLQSIPALFAALASLP